MQKNPYAKRIRWWKNQLLSAAYKRVTLTLVYPYIYKSVADSAKVLWIRPADIVGWLRGNRFDRVFFVGQIDKTDWHIGCTPTNQMLASSLKHQSVLDHFVSGVPWIETPLFKERYSRQLSRRQLEQKAIEYKRYDILFDSVRVDGFSPPNEAEGISPMYVCIGPRGEFYWTVDGNHRFAIARILGCPIPVLVLKRHHVWQLVRDDVSRGVLGEELLAHPDLQDLVG